MKAAVISGPGILEVASVSDPEPGPGEVVIEVAATGLCGTDLHILSGEPGRFPVIPGHEVSGTVVALGRDSTGLSVGDRVAVDPNLPCGRCRWCRAGRGNLCPTLGALGVTVNGGAAQYMSTPAANCLRLPDGIELSAATLIEPLSCAVHAFDVLRAQVGRSVLIYGAGTMGLMMLELAKQAGAVTVEVVERQSDRLAIATRLGCTAAAATADDLAREHGWDLVIDATGNADAIQDGLARVTRGGTFLQFGVPRRDATIAVRPYDIYHREITITGSMAVLHSFDRAAELLAAGALDPAVFITHRFPLDEARLAIESFTAGTGLKTQIIPQTQEDTHVDR